MFCKQCGKELEEDMAICSQCGYKIAQHSDKSNTNTYISTNADRQNITSAVKEKANNKKSKKALKIVLATLLPLIVIICTSLGLISYFNYKTYLPYMQAVEKLSSGFFVYENAEEVRTFSFSEYETRQSFFEKLLNIHSYCEVEINPHIYYLFDKETVEKDDGFKNKIEEEEDQEVYNDMPRICELVLEDEGFSITYDGEKIFDVFADSKDKTISSVTYYENDNSLIFSNESETSEKYIRFSAMVEEYADFKSRYENAPSVENAFWLTSITYGGMRIKISDFINKRFDNPDIKVTPNRLDENTYIITVKGDCLFTLNSYDPPYTQYARVIFVFDENENEFYCYNDDYDALKYYYYSLVIN